MEHVRLSPNQNVDNLLGMASQIQALADSEKEPLGFLPETAILDAICRKRLIAMTADTGSAREFAGYLLFSGVFPHAKVQQIAVVPKYRGQGVASALMRTIVAELEKRGFMTVRADVASDLPAAMAFYAKQGFEIVREREGGKARGRKILVHVRELETDTLFSLAERTPLHGLDLGLRRRSASKSPLFAFDVNIFLDLVKNRQHSDQARRLFGAALGHDIRLAVSDEFIKELRRNSNDTKNDPLFQMALNLPRLPPVDAAQQEQLHQRVHDIVFVQRSRRSTGSEQAISDARHLSHAALARASAFVTRDGAMLQARDELLLDVGIDVISLDELVDLLPADRQHAISSTAAGRGFTAALSSNEEVQAYLTEMSILAIVKPLLDANLENHPRLWKITEDRRTVAVGCLFMERSLEPTARLLVHVRPENPNSSLFADYLLDVLIRDACAGGPLILELEHIPGQATINSIARGYGFIISKASTRLTKIALGKPLTAQNWIASSKELQRRTGFVLPNEIPKAADARIALSFYRGSSVQISSQELENLLGPTIFVWSGRNGVMVPITRAYADELLGTGRQHRLSFIENMDAAFLAKRAYVNSPRSAKLIRPEMPIIFYESKRNGKGRGAVVAVARVVDAIISKKDELSSEDIRRLVVENISDFSKSQDVLLTTFDNLIQLPNPVPVKRLRELDAMRPANLVSPAPLSSGKISQILAEGW
ncbi:GNAT family N-acetyltransferase [Rhizobium laguerreae]|uniref:GNAT family N-acetyltransferase n=1 Tax=Rhizobium laguerreae TaxID=1076926 RepID=UPI001478CA7F|nr:GNAT family N-acetyltransferase [Rhizobium laguerreae]NNG70492.1 GNAT family N-acetyltransferase [Rhizobium laguerreae]